MVGNGVWWEVFYLYIFFIVYYGFVIFMNYYVLIVVGVYIVGGYVNCIWCNVVFLVVMFGYYIFVNYMVGFLDIKFVREVIVVCKFIFGLVLCIYFSLDFRGYVWIVVEKV